MSWTLTQLRPRVWLWYDGEWHDITADVRVRDGVSITRGYQSIRSDRADPLSLSLLLSCGTSRITGAVGRYSPRNPASDLFGKLGRSALLRVTVGTVPVAAATAVAVQENDHIAPSVTAGGDGLLICGWQTWSDPLAAWTPPGGMDDPIETTGAVGVGSAMLTAYEQVAAGATGTRTASTASAVRWAAASAWIPGSGIVVEEHIGNVVGNADVTVTTSAAQAGWWLVAVHGVGRDSRDVMLPPSGGGWQLIADTVTSSSLAPRVKVWARPVIQAGPQTVTASWLRVPGLTIEGDNHLRIMLLSGVDSWSVRAVAAPSTLPVRWDPSGRDAWAPVTAGGLLWSLSRGGREGLLSALRREALSVRNLGLAQYWPCEDGGGATQIASGLPGGPPMRINGTVTLAVDEQVDGSLPLPRMGDPGQFAVDFPPLGASGTTVVYRGMWSIPSGGPSVPLARLVDLFASGATATRWRLGIDTSGNLLMQAYDQTGTLIANSGAVAFGALGRTGLVGFSLVQAGSDVQWAMMARWVVNGQVVEEGGFNGTFSSIALGQVRGMVIGSGLLDFASGHHMLGTDTALGATLDDAIVGWRGETAGRRLLRLAAEEGVPLTVRGDPDATEAMGPQQPGQLIDLFVECADTDAGLLADGRTEWGIEYRTRADMGTQEPAVTLTYGSTGEVMPPMEPTDDPADLANDVTVRRVGGGSARAVLDDGPTGVASLGALPAEITVSAASDARLPELAAWHLRRLSWDEARWPRIRMSMAALANAGKGPLQDAVARLDLGDLLAIDNPPVGLLAPERVEVLPLGVRETLAPRVWDIDAMACTPARPYVVAELDSTDDRVALRVSPVSTVTAADFDAGTDTALSITGETWADSATYPDYYPVDIIARGIRLTVTAHASGVLTVDQTPVNGVTGITIPAGTPVELAERPGIGL